MATEPCPAVAGPQRAARRLAVGATLVATLIGSAACRPAAPAVAGVPEQVDFNFHVRPILSDKCFECHGPDDRARKGGLSLHTREGAFATLATGHRAVVPGNTGKSELVRRVLSTDPAVMMPMPDSHLDADRRREGDAGPLDRAGRDMDAALGLPAAEEGAGAHRLRPRARRPTRSTPSSAPTCAAPACAPSPEAPRETLIRRVSIDLTGLPPTVAEVDAFLADRSADAYEKVVDRLLASPAFGERMAADWLDVARYADSHGYQDDGMRQMSPWRDWVIEAFNRNMPVDQFITWQLAGDLLPDPTPEQRLATAFNRNHMQSQEGGIVSEEYRDRVRRRPRQHVRLGVPRADAAVRALPRPQVRPGPAEGLLQALRVLQQRQRDRADPVLGHAESDGDASRRRKPTRRSRRCARRSARSRRPRASTGWPPGPAFEAWLAKAQAAPEQPPVALPRPIVHLPLDAMKAYTFANLATPKRMGTVGSEDERKKKTARAPEVVPGAIGNAVRLVGDSQIDLGGRDENFGFFERNDPFSFAIWMRRDKAGVGGPVITRSGAVMNGHRGYELILRPDGTLTAGLHHVAPDNSLEIETVTPLTGRRLVSRRGHLRRIEPRDRACGCTSTASRRRRGVMTDNLARSIISEPLGDWGGISAIRLGTARRREPVGHVGRRVLRLPRPADGARGRDAGASRRRRRQA